MRFFPRDAFKNPPDTSVHPPIVQAQVQQLQQMHQFQQQIWQQIGMPMAVLQVSIVDPMFLYILLIRAQQQALAILMRPRPSSMWLDPQLADPAWHFMDPSGLGYQV